MKIGENILGIAQKLEDNQFYLRYDTIPSVSNATANASSWWMLRIKWNRR